MSQDQTYSVGMFVLGLLFVIAEIYLGVDAAFDLVVLGSILLIGSSAGYFSDSIILALAISSFLSFAYFFVGRKYMQAKLQIQFKPSNIDAVKGRVGIAKTHINSKTKGTVIIEGEQWSANSEDDIETGEEVVVERSDGVILQVKKEKV